MVQATSKPRRTLLECMPRRTVFRTLSYLSMHDVIQLLCADKRLRPFVYAPSFAPWRKRYLKLRHAEYWYEHALRHTPTDDDACDAADQALDHAYEEALVAMQLHSAPIHLSEASCALLLCAAETLPPPERAQRFLVPWMLGRVQADEAFALFDHAQAVELLYFLRVFLLLVRLSRLSQPSSFPSTQYHQMFHVLDADCADTLDAFFAPPLESLRTHHLTSEQARFVNFQVRRSDLVCVQAYAGVRISRSHRRAKRARYWPTRNNGHTSGSSILPLMQRRHETRGSDSRRMWTAAPCTRWRYSM